MLIAKRSAVKDQSSVKAEAKEVNLTLLSALSLPPRRRWLKGSSTPRAKQTAEVPSVTVRCSTCPTTKQPN